MSVSTLAASFERHRLLRAGIVPTKPPRKKREHGYRRAEVAAWLESRWFGVTRRQIAETFAEYYPTLSSGSASERRIHRDLIALVATGRFVRVGDPFIGTKIIRTDRARRIG